MIASCSSALCEARADGLFALVEAVHLPHRSEITGTVQQQLQGLRACLSDGKTSTQNETRAASPLGLGWEPARERCPAGHGPWGLSPVAFVVNSSLLPPVASGWLAVLTKEANSGWEN